MADFIPFFGSIGWTLAAFVVALSVIVAVHEYGHYIVGRWSGIHAEVFSLGFGPVIWSRMDKHGTRWQIAALPLGGYVKFLGDANAASAGGTKGGRNTMLGAPLWARSATVFAGPLANFIFSAVVFAIFGMIYGIVSYPMTVRSVPDLPAPYVVELQEGDQILAIEGMEISRGEDLSDVLDALPLEPALDYTIRRDGTEMVVLGPYPQTTTVQSISFDKPAAPAGVKEGDVVTAINGQPVFAFDQMIQIVNASGGGELILDIWRAGETLQIAITPEMSDVPRSDGTFETRYIMGINGGIVLDAETEFPGLWTAIENGAWQVWYVIKLSLSGMWYMIVGDISTCNLSSPVGIAQASGAMAAAGLADFITFLGFLSTAVGLLNLFPIPVLDGGHLVFHAYEAVTGKPPSDKVLRVMFTIGLTLILSLMVFALTNELFLC
ncbi:RIP metalloprotease RseP [Loktanella sp. IMCC34160]|uniref:RIP metalloprotease RseP n=1 Tax=Loktanella sp. IMCC34160 TaxID=2510646 RepID=UPI00101D720F|nr:RIP metalloprotease RseP [Loktanella sp. IMCC34160]RYG92181.1 RIP metalloprotease RseP [Loktanella sp. IMCC34160]